MPPFRKIFNYISQFYKKPAKIQRPGSEFVKAEDFNSFAAAYRRQQSFLDVIKFALYNGSSNLTLQDRINWCSKEVYRHCGYFPNIREPRTYNEWINWYKFNYADPLMTYCVDKLTLKNYVSEKIGAKYVCKLYSAVSSAIDLAFSGLPSEYIIKSNISSGSRNVLKIDASASNPDRIRYVASQWLNPWNNIFYHTFDWAYKDIEPRVIVEEYLKDKYLEVKVFCWNGLPELLFVDSDSLTKETYSNLFDLSWNVLPVMRHGKPFPTPPARPDNLDELLRCAAILSEPFPHARVDFMLSPSATKVSEITFYTGSGFHSWKPKEWDYTYGKLFSRRLFNKYRKKRAAFLYADPSAFAPSPGERVQENNYKQIIDNKSRIKIS